MYCEQYFFSAQFARRSFGEQSSADRPPARPSHIASHDRAGSIAFLHTHRRIIFIFTAMFSYIYVKLLYISHIKRRNILYFYLWPNDANVIIVVDVIWSPQPEIHRLATIRMGEHKKQKKIPTNAEHTTFDRCVYKCNIRFLCCVRASAFRIRTKPQHGGKQRKNKNYRSRKFRSYESERAHFTAQIHNATLSIIRANSIFEDAQ